MDRTCIVILGMHRSGTSALSGLLQRMGVDFSADLIGPNESNPRGHFESTAVVAFNDRLLRRLGSRWKRSFSLPADWRSRARDELAAFQKSFVLPAGNPCGIKDPRLCRLVPVWREILGDSVRLKFLLSLRHPQEVSASLARRDGIELSRARTLWLEHFCRAEKDTRGCPRLLVDYDGLLRDAERTCRELAEFLALPPPPHDVFAGFLDPALQHQATRNQPPGCAEALHEVALSGDSVRLAALVDDVLAAQDFREECVRTERPRQGWFR